MMSTVTNGGDRGLAAAIEGLYETFEDYPLRPSTEPCRHCHSEADEAALHSGPLRELTAEDLAKFAAHAMTTWGELADFKHFLPRLLEIVAIDASEFVEVEVVVGKLSHAKWRGWPADEQSAVETFLQAWWTASLSEFPGNHGSETLVGAVGLVIDDLGPFLATWSELPGSPPVRHMADLLTRNEASLQHKSRLSSPWLKPRRAQQAQVVDWLRGTAVAERLERDFAAAGDADYVETLAWAMSIAEDLDQSAASRSA